MPSLLFRREPEILFDAPSRIEPGRPIPLFLIVKDAGRFPVTLEAVIVRLTRDDGGTRVLRFPYDDFTVDTPLWWDSFNIVPEGSGMVYIQAAAIIRAGKRRMAVETDNYPGTTRRPLAVSVSPEPIPTAPGWFHGDIHCHTAFTGDQIEFGAPLEAVTLAAACRGLDWIAATDHSYDLDDREDDYLAGDPALPKWNLLRKKAELLNESLDGFTIIPGEEVTCRTRRGRNCHLLALNAERFIRGSGDGGEHGLRTATEHSIAEAAAIAAEWGGLSCAAHPFERVGWAERIVLNRGGWDIRDLVTTGVSAMQFYNGVRDRGFRRGMRAWVRLLLDGHRIAAFGGSDSHGDMNRRRGVSIPFISLGESSHNLLGTVRTAVRAFSRALPDVMDALRNGRALVTDGPFIDLVVDPGGADAGPGGGIAPGRVPVRAEFLSTPEFGALRRCRLLAGAFGAGEERPIPVFERPGGAVYRHEFESALSLERPGYLRAECETVTGKRCFTNPVWIGDGGRPAS